MLSCLVFSYVILSSIVSEKQVVGVERLIGHLLVYKSHSKILPLLFSTPAHTGLYLFLAPCRAVFAAICLRIFCSCDDALILAWQEGVSGQCLAISYWVLSCPAQCTVAAYSLLKPN